MRTKVIMSVLLLLSFNSCGLKELIQTANMSKPSAKLENVKVQALTFSSIDLLFEIKIDNPNPVAIKLLSFDYDLKIEDNSFVKGNQNNGFSIDPNASSVVKIPISLGFKELFSTIKTLTTSDSAGYKLAGNLEFDLPILGALKMPYSTTGKLPVFRLPAISFGSIKLNSISFTGAEINLSLKVENKNPLGISIDKIAYALNVNDRPWVSSLSNNSIEVGAKSISEVAIPIKLNFAEIGRSVSDIISGNSDMKFKLQGDMDFKSVNDLLPKSVIEFMEEGKTKLIR